MAIKPKILGQVRLRRKKRARAKSRGTAERPRLSVFRSNRYTAAQLIDDQKGETIIGLRTREVADDKKQAVNRLKQAEEMGELMARKAIEKGIKKAFFDRGNYKYHGRIKAVAEGARKGGLQL